MSIATDRRQEDQASGRWLVLVIVSLAQFMVVLDTTIVNVALPSIQRGLQFSAVDLPWVLDAYLLAFGGCLLLGGRAADLLGRRRLFIAGVAVFSLGSLVSGAAPSAAALIAGRVLQGLGGALLSPAALSTLTTTFADSRERATALGVWSGIAAGSLAVGLLLGGLLTDALSWRWIFLINLPVGVAGMLAALRFVPESQGGLRHRTFDLAGAVTVTAGLVVLVYTLVNAQGWGWSSGRTVAAFATSAVLLAAFVMIERRTRFPLMRLSIFRVRPLAAADAAWLLTASGLFAMFYFTSLYVQDVLGYSPSRSGLALLPLTAGIIGGAAAAQPLIRVAGVRVIGAAGLTIATAGMVLLAGISVHGSYVLSFLPGLLMVSGGMGLATVPITLLATAGVEPGDAGLASGIYNTVGQVGGAVGLAILSTAAATRTAGILRSADGTLDARLGALVSGFQVAYVAGAVLLGCAAVTLMVLTRRGDAVAPEAAEPIVENAA
jgi:EmrB/QacA subfamily drug resistance transporter